MEHKDEIMVSVIVCTYNQENWIRQTLDSILAQETEYPFEVIIGEDHGTDGTRAICQEYVEKVKGGKRKVESGRGLQSIRLLPSNENLGVTANWIHCVQAGSGKYIMGCAGDDWWHNPKKIQLQVDFMEGHPECVLCHTELDEYYEHSHTYKKNINSAREIVPPEGRIQQEILRGKDKIGAVTMCIRRETFEKYVPANEFARRRFPREDWPTQLVLAAHGDILYIPESTATYRVGQESITRTSNYEKIIACAQKDKEMTEYLYSLFPEWGPFEDGSFFDNIGYHHAMMAAYRNNDYKAAHKYAKMDKYPNKATKMAKTWLTFKIYRWLKIVKS